MYVETNLSYTQIFYCLGIGTPNLHNVRGTIVRIVNFPHI